jgi:hypothetical protein
MCINLFVSGKKFAKKVKLKILTIEKENDFFVGLQFPELRENSTKKARFVYSGFLFVAKNIQRDD